MLINEVLIVSPCYSPAVKFGGPVFSLLGISERLYELTGEAVDVVAPRYGDPDGGEDLSVSLGWADQDFNRVFWVRTPLFLQAHDLLQFFAATRSRYGTYYVNGTFNLATLMAFISARIFSKRVIFSPRGAIQAMYEGAGNRRTVPLKRLLLWAYSFFLTENDIVLASSQHEADVSKFYLGKCVFRTLPNIVPRVSDTGFDKRLNNEPRVLVLGRLHPKKGIDLVIEALRLLPRTYKLDLYGSGSSEYIAKLRRLVSSHGLEKRVNFGGFVDGSAKHQVFKCASMLVLPSESENFGNVVLESLSFGTPVIISRNMPFQDVDEFDVGRVSERDAQAIAAAILSLPPLKTLEQSERCQQYFAELCGDDINEQIHSIFRLRD